MRKAKKNMAHGNSRRMGTGITAGVREAEDWQKWK